jgi:putative nucleotide binding protein
MGKKEPVAYAVGDEEFKLFILVPKTNAIFGVGDRVYIGKDTPTQKRDVIDHVKSRIGYGELTNHALSELEYAIIEIGKLHEDRFIRFFNEAQAISLRKHLLEEIPGLGKKSVEEILREREKAKFESFADLTERAKIKVPEKLIARRIIEEIESPDLKRYLFVSK